MTQTSKQTMPRTSMRPTTEQGPVLLVATPFGGMDAPIAAARWYAAHEERTLRVVATLEREENRAGAAPDQPVPADCREVRCRMIADQLRRELAQHGLKEDESVHVFAGATADSIVDSARRRGAPIIVVGTGRSGGGGCADGELPMQIVAASDRPVLVVPGDAMPTTMDVVVVAVDFSPASVRAARAALPLVSFGGRLILVHVRTAVSLNQQTAEWWDDLYARRCAELLGEFRRQLQPTAGVRIETRFLRGEAAGTVAAFAAGCGAGLIACGRKRHSARARARTGGTSSRLIGHAPCAVLVVPEMPGDAATR